MITGVRKNRSFSGKPCEDVIQISRDGTALALCDGVTRLMTPGSPYPVPSLSELAAQIAAETFILTVESEKSEEMLPTQLVLKACKEANRAVGAINESPPGLSAGEFEDLAAVSFIGAAIESGILYSISIGDSIIAGRRNGIWKILNILQTAAIDRARIGPPTAEGYLAERKIRNNPAQPLSFGSLTGEQSAASFFESQTIALADFDELHISSDGILTLYQENHPILSSGSIDEIFDAMESIEDARGIRSDDKALIKVL